MAIEESDILAFIAREGNPAVTIAELKSSFGDSSWPLVRFHIGSLFRKNMIDRQSSSDQSLVAYWTPENAELAKEAGFKSSIVPQHSVPAKTNPTVSESPFPVHAGSAPHIDADAGVQHPPPAIEGSEEEVSIPKDAATSADKPIEEKAPIGVSMDPAMPRMGTLRRSALTGRLAAVMLANASMSLTDLEVLKLCPDISIIDIRRVLTGLATNIQDDARYIRRSKERPFTYTWSGAFAYPFTQVEPGDDKLLVRKDAPVVEQAVEPEADDKQAIEPEVEAAPVEVETARAVTTVFPKFPTSEHKLAVENPVTEIPLKSYGDPAPIEKVSEVVRTTEAVVNPVDLPGGCDTGELRLPKSPTFKGRIVYPTPKFSASLDTSGTLTIVDDDQIMVLPRDKAMKLLRLIGPMYNHQHAGLPYDKQAR